MASEQETRPETYGDVFGQQVGAELANKPIVREDAAAMQSAEGQVFGVTQKGGAAAMMQSAADRSIQRGVLSPDAPSMVREPGMQVVAEATPGGQIVETEYVQGTPVVSGVVEVEPANPKNPQPGYNIEAVEFTYTETTTDVYTTRSPMDMTEQEDDGRPRPETIGQALETAAIMRDDKKVTEADARAVQTAEAHAAGGLVSPTGPAAVTQANVGKAVLRDVLLDATDRMPQDKVVTVDDAAAVASAEARANQGRIEPHGVAASMQSAADYNVDIGAA